MEVHASSEGGHPAALSPEEARRARSQVVKVFVALLAMTLVEVAVATSSAGRGAVVTALVGLAVAKAALVGLFFMHLRQETPVLRWTALGPLLAPGVYGIVLAADAAWRVLR
jgi:caa(3)-type oxidase subunit IV